MKKFIALIRNIANKTANVGPYSEKAQDAYMAARVKRLMKKAYESGWDAGWYEASKIDWESSGPENNPGYENFNEWFKKKYEK